MEGTYLQHLPKDLREELIRFGGYWPSYIERLPPELRKVLAMHLKGVWFRAHVVKEPLTEAILILTDLVFIEPGKRTMTIEKFAIPISKVNLPVWLWSGNITIQDVAIPGGRDLEVRDHNIQEFYSNSVRDLFFVKLARATIDLAGKYLDIHHRRHLENLTEGPYTFRSLEGMYEDIV